MKKILVTMRMDFEEKFSEWRDSIDQRLEQFLIEAGYLPVLMPNSFCGSSLNLKKEWLDFLKPDGILLSGGGDVRSVNTKRFLTETYLLNYAKVNNLPVLGICRGMQAMATFSGAKLKRVYGHVAVFHGLNGDIEESVNSFHEFSIEAAPEGYEVIAKSLDGEIEAIRHARLPWHGWMWHPERMQSSNPGDIRRVREIYK